MKYEPVMEMNFLNTKKMNNKRNRYDILSLFLRANEDEGASTD